jgi:hypothetical protein
MAVDVVSVVCECPGCGERLCERRWGDCNVLCRRLGVGGRCLTCDEAVLVEELAGEA